MNNIDKWSIKYQQDIIQPTEDEKEHPYSEMVDSPAHYTSGRVEVIEVIEDAVNSAPSCQAAVSQANALKYLLRLWHKDNALQDAKKAQWYLKRLISLLE